MAPRTRGVIAADIELIQTMVNSTIAHPIDGLPVRSIEGMVEWIDANFSKLEQMKADEEISEDGLPEITRMQTIMQRVKFDCLRNLGERPPIPPRIGPPIIQQGNPRTSRAKIERETIPRFDGNIRKFKKFWIPFKSLVWSNPELDSSEKLRRLYANVNESVHRLLPDIDNTVIDLDQIEDDLKREFQDEVKLQLEFRTVLTSLPEFKNCYDSQGWRRVEEVARDIKSLFPEDVVFHHTALKEIAKKLPFQGATKLRLSARFTIETLLDICKEFITAESRMDNPPTRETTTSNSEQRNRTRNDNRGQNYRANVVATQSLSMCLICLGSHDTTDCRISLDERRRMVIQRKGCFRCLRAYTRQHECSRVETCQRCNRAHNVLIGCGNNIERASGTTATRRSETGRPASNQSDNSNNARPSERSTVSQSSSNELLNANQTTRTLNDNLIRANVNRYTPVVQVIVEFNQRKQQVRAILDCGADVSHITISCAQRLGAPIIDNGITRMSAFANPTTETRDLVTEIKVRSLTTANSVLIPFHVVPTISYGHYAAPSNQILNWMAERGFEITDEEGSTPPDVLIGNDMLEEFFWTGRRERIAPFLWARETHFGWCVVGPDTTFSSKQSRINNHKCNLISKENCTCHDLKTIFDVDQWSEPPPEPDWLQTYADSIRFDTEERRYVIKLPWIQNHQCLQNNLLIAERQAKKLHFRLRNNEKLDDYNAAIRAYLPDFAEPCGPPKPESYYVPHHAVYKENSTTKTRIVFNCSSSAAEAVSLNQCLFKGSITNCDVRPLLIKFRLSPEVATADIVKAFLQILVDPQDRDFLRYLWYDEEDKLRSYRMKTLIFGATSSPAILGAVIFKHANVIAERFPEVSELLRRNLYMDDVILTQEIDSTESGWIDKRVQELHDALNEASFEVHKIHSSKDKNTEVSCLGLHWTTGRDTLKLPGNNFLPALPTVREAASYLAKFFDPLGLVLPITMQARKFMRGIVELGWEVKIDEIQRQELFEIKEQFDDIILKEFRRAPPVRAVPRFHIFGDASQQAICAVAYVELINKEMFFILARGRLAPKKSTETTPLLEMKAAVMASQMALTIKKIFPYSTIQLYSDSKITLCRIKTKEINKYPANIIHWILKIKENTEITEWSYVPTNLNPADIGTRPIDWKTLEKKEAWWKGPNLKELERAVVKDEMVVDPAIKTLITTKSTEVPFEGRTNKLATCRPFLRWFFSEADRRFGYMERINRNKNRKLNLSQFVELTIIKKIQNLQFPDGSKGFDETLRTKAPFRDEWGLIRLRKRLDLADIDIDQKYPIVIKQHPIIKKMARAVHENLLHAGAVATFEQLSQVFHIIGGRKMVRDITRKCFLCNRMRGKNFDTPSAPLPKFRIQPTYRAFDTVGCDVFGPILICKNHKYYGLIFTCAITRGVHLELIENMSSNTILNAVKRFIATRGLPTEIHTDNAKYFKAISSKLRRILEAAKSVTNDQIPAISWIFQPPMAPWWGGFFERMIGTIKRYLTSSTWRKTLTPTELATLIKQVEAIVNSRPLIRLSEGVLTPAHFYTGTSLLNFSPFKLAKPADHDILRHHNRLQNLLRHFWSRWTFSYLTQLRSYHHNVSHRQPQIGELVAITEKDRARECWPIAQIKELIAGPDGVTRVAVVKTLDQRTLTRAVKLLVPLEVPRSDESHTTASSAAGEDVANSAIRQL